MDFRLLDARAQEAIPIAPFREWTCPDGTLWTQFYRTDSGHLLRFPGLADFTVSADALTVACHPAPDATVDTAKHLFLNQVAPLVLSKLGALVFHASAVEIDEGAVAFVAQSGRGKSTLAACFSTSGYRFLTDDGLIIESAEDGFRAVPSHPSIRLWQDSQEAIASAAATTAPPLPYTSKACFVGGREFAFCDVARPLRQAYFLGEGNAPVPTFSRVSARVALVEWVRHSFLLDLEEQDTLAAHFDGVVRLANQMRCYRLDYPRRFDQLALLRDAILEHLHDAREAA